MAKAAWKRCVCVGWGGQTMHRRNEMVPWYEGNDGKKSKSCLAAFLPPLSPSSHQPNHKHKTTQQSYGKSRRTHFFHCFTFSFICSNFYLCSHARSPFLPYPSSSPPSLLPSTTLARCLFAACLTMAVQCTTSSHKASRLGMRVREKGIRKEVLRHQKDACRRHAFLSHPFHPKLPLSMNSHLPCIKGAYVLVQFGVEGLKVL